MATEELHTRLQLKKKMASVLQQHKDVLETLRTQTRKVQTNYLIEFARNISYSLSAPPNYKEGGATHLLFDRLLGSSIPF